MHQKEGCVTDVCGRCVLIDRWSIQWIPLNPPQIGMENYHVGRSSTLINSHINYFTKLMM